MTMKENRKTMILTCLLCLLPMALGAMLLTGLLGARTGLTVGVSLTVLLANLAAGSNTVVGVIELDGSGKAVAYGSAEINVG